MSNMDEQMYIDLDYFIANNRPEFAISSVSSYILKKGKEIYNEYKNLQNTNINPNPIYTIFGGTGYVTYGLYKSKEQIIYLVAVYLQTITDYLIMDSNNEKLFDL
jgi:hypothetical protein